MDALLFFASLEAGSFGNGMCVMCVLHGIVIDRTDALTMAHEKHD
jgi:hypothetical protein